MISSMYSSIGRAVAMAVLLTGTSLVYAQTSSSSSSSASSNTSTSTGSNTSTSNDTDTDTSASSDTSTSTGTNSSTSVEELAKLQQNPLSGLRQLALEATLSPDMPVTGGTEGAYTAQLVWPFDLNKDWKMITYSILPVLQVPEGHGDYMVGLGNTLLNFFVTPSKTKGNFVWGVGPAVMLPTHTKAELGSDRVGLGPAAVLYYAKNEWGAGLVLQNVWSLGGDASEEVDAFAGQYFLNYNLTHGWFLYSNSTITADWTADSDNRWTVPVSGGFGKVFKIGGQSMSAAFQGTANVVRPDDSAKWAVNFQVGFLFP